MLGPGIGLQRPVRSDTEAFSVLFQFLIDYHERGEQLAADINWDGNTTNTQGETWSSTLAGVSDCEREGEELLISDMNGFLPTNLPLTISQSAGSETICLEINTIIIEINKPLSLHPGPDDQSLCREARQRKGVVRENNLEISLRTQTQGQMEEPSGSRFVFAGSLLSSRLDLSF